MKTNILVIIFLVFSVKLYSQVWVPDNGDGTYTNPIIHADYSDPDVIRVGEDYFMVASSFNCAPGIPVLHSKDLVNWEIINHVYDYLPFDRYKNVMHGQGSWAPSIRYHNNLYYVYFCTPEEGLFVATTKDPRAKWKLHHVLDVAQWEDPCPFWDDDGRAWLVRSKLCGGPVYLHRMSDDGLKLLDNGKIVYHDPETNPVLEGLKVMKRNDYYYIFAPSGGVTKGWQTVLRSKNIEGPYDAKRVLDEGNGINGPHQGGLIDTPSGEWWFIHFQDRQAYGRIAHLQPAKWLENDWIVIGEDLDGDGCGIPVLKHKKPDVGAQYPIKVPQTSDEFELKQLGLQWQWQGAEMNDWYSLKKNRGSLRLYPIASPTEEGNLHYSPNMLLQKIPAPSCVVTTKIDVSSLQMNERAGLVVSGLQHSYLSVERNVVGYSLKTYYGKYFGCGFSPLNQISVDTNHSILYLKVNITADQKCYYSYSIDGENFVCIGDSFKIFKGRWIGAKVGLFCINPNVEDGKGFVDFEYFRVN